MTKSNNTNAKAKVAKAGQSEIRNEINFLLDAGQIQGVATLSLPQPPVISGCPPLVHRRWILLPVADDVPIPDGFGWLAAEMTPTKNDTNN